MNGKQLKNSILQWAIQGKLVPQDASEEPAIELLKRLNPKVKPITEDVPFEVPKSWVWCTIKDVGNIVTGSTPPKANKEYYEGNIPFFKPTDLEQGRNVCFSRDHLSQLGFEISRQLPSGSILVTCIGATIGKTGMTSIEGTCNQQINAIIPYKEIFPPYIYYVCNSDFFQYKIKNNASATTLPILNKNNFSKLFVPLPPLAEQKRIVAKIEELMPLVERYTKAQEGLDKLNAGIKGKLRASILQEAIQGHLVPQDANEEPAIELLKRLNPKFTQPEYEGELPRGWSVATLSDICDTINGLWKGKKEPFIKVGVIRNANFTKDFKLDYSKIEYLDVEEKSFKKRNLLNGDLIVEKSGGGEKTPVGRSILYEGEDGIYSFSNFTMLLRIKDKKEIFPKYLYYFLLSKYWSGAMFDMQTNTTGLHNLLTDIYLSINVPLPPLAEQKRIVAKIEELFAVLDNGPKKDPKGD